VTSAPAGARRPVFLVGCARTGSTLLRHVLNRSPEVAIAPETHFMRRADRLRLSERLAAARTPGGLRTLVDTLYTVDHHSRTGYWAWLRRSIDPDEFADRLATTDRSARALFRLCIDLYVERSSAGRIPRVIGEKTPSHLLFVPTLVEWFPGTLVIHTFRDPRAIYASELRRRREGRWGIKRRLPWIPSGIIDPLLAPVEAVRTTLAWRRADRLDGEYRRLLGDRYHLVRFEDLVRQPEVELRAICELIGIEFEPGLLQIDVVGSSFEPTRHAAGGFDPATAERWRAHLHPLARAWFRLVLGRSLARRGYRL